MIAFGEEHLASSLAAILIAAVPLFVAGLALRFDRSERPTPTRLVGMLVGLTGVAALVGIDVSGSSVELVGALAIPLAAFGYACCGPMIVKRQFSQADPIGPIGALGLASLFLLPAGLAGFPERGAERRRDRLLRVRSGIVCTAIAFPFFFR